MKLIASQPNLLKPETVSLEKQIENAKLLKEKSREFVGQAFFGQMMKAMRSTQEKPAYFHGGRAEEVFQGQLDQMLAEEMTNASSTQFADPIFEKQYPKEAALLKAVENKNSVENSVENKNNQPGLSDLQQLRRI